MAQVWLKVTSHAGTTEGSGTRGVRACNPAYVSMQDKEKKFWNKVPPRLRQKKQPNVFLLRLWLVQVVYLLDPGDDLLRNATSHGESTQRQTRDLLLDLWMPQSQLRSVLSMEVELPLVFLFPAKFLPFTSSIISQTRISLSDVMQITRS